MTNGSLMVFSGNANPKLTNDIVGRLQIPLGKAIVDRFSDGEIQVEIMENVRGRDVFIVQPTCAPTNEHLMELLVLVDAVQTGHAEPGFVHEISGEDLSSLPAVAPHFLGIGEVLALGRKLGLDMPRQVKVFAIEVKDPHTVGTGLTPALENALPDILRRVEAAL